MDVRTHNQGFRLDPEADVSPIGLISCTRRDLAELFGPPLTGGTGPSWEICFYDIFAGRVVQAPQDPVSPTMLPVWEVQGAARRVLSLVEAALCAKAYGQEGKEELPTVSEPESPEEVFGRTFTKALTVIDELAARSGAGVLYSESASSEGPGTETPRLAVLVARGEELVPLVRQFAEELQQAGRGQGNSPAGKMTLH